MDMTVHDGRRWSAANAYLKPALKRPNLEVRTHALATSIVMDGRWAAGAFDPCAQAGLKPVHVRSLEGLLFICLAEEPPADFDDMAAEIGPYLAPHDLRNAKVAYEYDLVEPGDWKLTMENNRECYHCAANHPELAIPLFAYGFGFAPEDLDDLGRIEAQRYADLVKTSHSAWESCGFPSRMIEQLDDRITGFRTERLPLDGSGESHTHDTKAACRKMLGAINDPRRGAPHV